MPTRPVDAVHAAGGAPAALGAGRRLTDQGVERRQQIVDAAGELFTRNGYRSTRILDICDQAGVAKGLFYWYFNTKLDVFVEVARSMQQRLRRAQAAAAPAGASALDRIAAGTEASVRFMAEHASYFALIEIERSDPELRDALRTGSQVYRADVAGLIAQAQREGSVGPLDVDLAATGVMGTVAAFAHALRSGTAVGTPDEVALAAAGWVTRALRPDATIDPAIDPAADAATGPDTIVPDTIVPDTIDPDTIIPATIDPAERTA